MTRHVDTDIPSQVKEFDLFEVIKLEAISANETDRVIEVMTAARRNHKIAMMWLALAFVAFGWSIAGNSWRMVLSCSPLWGFIYWLWTPLEVIPDKLRKVRLKGEIVTPYRKAGIVTNILCSPNYVALRIEGHVLNVSPQRRHIQFLDPKADELIADLMHFGKGDVIELEIEPATDVLFSIKPPRPLDLGGRKD